MPLASPGTAVESRVQPMDHCRGLVDTAFSLKGVSFDYQAGMPALSQISFDIARGEKVALLGANGSGKSTLLKVLNGLEFPSRGALTCFGDAISETALKDEDYACRFRRRVGFVFQNSDSQLFCSTVRAELAFGPLHLRLPPTEIETRVAEVASMLEITQLLERAPFRLSGGEKKKVALASILVINPDVILLDEPTNNLDPRSQRWLIDILLKLNEAGKTIVSATHDLDVANEISDRAVVLTEDHGLAAIGPTRDILHDTNLLTSVNLIHEHMHWHGNIRHSHPHHHDSDHDHHHHEHDHAL